MTISFNDWILTVQQDGLEEGIHVTASEWDGWGSVGFARKQRPYGTWRTWVLNGMELGLITYSNSVIGSLSRYAGSLLPGDFEVNEASWSSGTWSTYIRDLSWHYENRDRFYTVTLQERQT